MNEKKKVVLSKEQMTRLKNAMLVKTIALGQVEKADEVLKSFQKDVKIAELNVKLAATAVRGLQANYEEKDKEYVKVREELGKELGISFESGGVNEITGEFKSKEEM